MPYKDPAERKLRSGLHRCACGECGAFAWATLPEMLRRGVPACGNDECAMRGESMRPDAATVRTFLQDQSRQTTIRR